MEVSSNTRPLVSVVIPAYKARNYLHDALETVRLQDYGNLEIIVIDDASPEPIEDIVASHRAATGTPPLSVLRHDANRGLGATRNTGITAAKGEYIALLDHDDLWTPEHVSDILDGILKTGSDIGFCSAMLFTGSPEQWSGLWGPPRNMMGDKPAFELFNKSYVTPSSAIIRKSLLIELNGFNTAPEVHMCEDLDLWLRMARHGARFYYSNIPSTYYRNHPNQATSKTGYMACQAAHVRQIHVKTVNGPWFKKRSLVAAGWWNAFIATRVPGEIRWDLLRQAIRASLPVPWEIGRGICHLLGIRVFRNRRSQPPE